ncbi:hypothetical protein E5163_00680 [Marinicauda algicola]|uniref:Lipoprotein n=1 Tax=Marinicauda algicola TaxID=2029849 RepID=A0A4S2H265_9PROT|nr:hypothetical protein [Marinicauda algicola]TGY89690.1 hypothetical protein E5163_00680 [Marinicauda algicola]
MRLALAALALLALCACGDQNGPYFAGGNDTASAGEPQEDGAAQDGEDRPAARCSGRQSHPVALTGQEASDRIAIEVDRQTCPEAAALVTLRAGDGTLLVAEAFPLKALALAAPPSRETLHALLSSFTENVTRRPAGELEPLEEATHEGPRDPSAIRLRASPDLYERARSQGGNVICFPIHYENFECVWYDREHGQAIVLYTSGP